MTMELARIQNVIFNQVADNTERYLAKSVIARFRILDSTEQPIPFGEMLKRIRAENPRFYEKLESSDSD